MLLNNVSTVSKKNELLYELQLLSFSCFASIGEMNETNTVAHMDSSYTDYLTNQIDSNFCFSINR